MLLIVDDEKVQLESNKTVGAHDVKIEFDVCATCQPSMVHEVKKLDEEENIDTTVNSMDQQNVVSFASLIPRLCNSK